MVDRRSYGRGFTFAAYFLLFATIAGALFLIHRFDYKWTWQKVPQYFWSSEMVEQHAAENGTIDLSKPGMVVLKGDSGTKYEIKAETALVKDGELVFAGDVIAKDEHGRPGPLIEGLLVTLELSLASTLLGILLGLLTGLAKVSANPILRLPAVVYVEIIRGTPLLVQLFIMYFMIGPVIGMNDRFACGMWSLSLFAGAYAGEIFRAGIETIHRGQNEAARSLGLSASQAMIYVTLPQVFRNTLPALAGTFISLIKDSSLVSVMALTDLTKAGREIISSSFMVFEIWTMVALLYFALTFAMSYWVRRLEVYLSKGTAT